MNLKLLLGIIVAIIAVTLVMIMSSLREEETSNKEESKRSGDYGNFTNDIKPTDRASSSSNPRNTKYKTITDKYLGVTVQYDRIIKGDEFTLLVEKFSPNKSQAFKDSSISAYIKDDSIVLLQLNPNRFESISRIDEVMNFFAGKNIFKINSYESTYLKVDDATKMNHLIQYLSSKGWDSEEFFKTSNSMAFIEISPLEEGNKGNPNMVYLDEDKSYPAFFSVTSNGKAPFNTPNNDLLYDRDLCIQRYFAVNAIVQDPEYPDRNPFQFGLGSGIYVEEPTQAAIDKYGVLHPPAKPIGQ